MSKSSPSALALLVPGVVADDHDPAVPADHLALVTDLLHRRLDLHRCRPSFLDRAPTAPIPGAMPREACAAERLLVAVDDATAGQVVGRELHDHAVLGQDADVVLPHLAADVGEHPVPVLQLDPEHRIGQRLDDATLDLDGPVFLRHAVNALPDSVVLEPLRAHGRTRTDTLGGCRTGGADVLARAFQVVRPQHNHGTARTPSFTVPRPGGWLQPGLRHTGSGPRSDPERGETGDAAVLGRQHPRTL